MLTFPSVFSVVFLIKLNDDVGFNPSLCAVDFCLSDLGFGYNMTMGTKTITFYGNAEIPEIENVFLEGSVSGANGMALSLQDLALEWNKIVGNEIGLPLNISDVPSGKFEMRNLIE